MFNKTTITGLTICLTVILLGLLIPKSTKSTATKIPVPETVQFRMAVLPEKLELNHLDADTDSEKKPTRAERRTKARKSKKS